jgi:hypothetical protein
MHHITLRGGPYDAQVRPVPEPPPFDPAFLFGPNKYSPSLYYAFHKVGDTWAPVAIYIQDPYERDLFHYHADTTVKDVHP